MSDLTADNLAGISLDAVQKTKQEQRNHVFEKLYRNLDPQLKCAAKQGFRSQVIYERYDQGWLGETKLTVQEECETVKDLFGKFQKHLFSSKFLQTDLEIVYSNFWRTKIDSCKITARW